MMNAECSMQNQEDGKQRREGAGWLALHAPLCMLHSDFCLSAHASDNPPRPSIVPPIDPHRLHRPDKFVHGLWIKKTFHRSDSALPMVVAV
jgi:hypothetical protein